MRRLAVMFAMGAVMVPSASAMATHEHEAGVAAVTQPLSRKSAAEVKAIFTLRRQLARLRGKATREAAVIAATDHDIEALEAGIAVVEEQIELAEEHMSGSRTLRVRLATLGGAARASAGQDSPARSEAREASGEDRKNGSSAGCARSAATRPAGDDARWYRQALPKRGQDRGGRRDQRERQRETAWRAPWSGGRHNRIRRVLRPGLHQTARHGRSIQRVAWLGSRIQSADASRRQILLGRRPTAATNSTRRPRVTAGRSSRRFSHEPAPGSEYRAEARPAEQMGAS